MAWTRLPFYPVVFCDTGAPCFIRSSKVQEKPRVNNIVTPSETCFFEGLTVGPQVGSVCMDRRAERRRLHLEC